MQLFHVCALFCELLCAPARRIGRRWEHERREPGVGDTESSISDELVCISYMLAALSACCVFMERQTLTKEALAKSDWLFCCEERSKGP